MIGLDALGRWSELGTLLLRLFLGITLVYGTADNVFDRARMIEFRDFLAQNGFPWPLASAYLSAYAQFVCGLLIAVGLWTRQAALAMVINFIVALLMVHVTLPFSANISPLAMLFCSIFFLFHGAGRLSIDARRGVRV